MLQRVGSQGPKSYEPLKIFMNSLKGGSCEMCVARSWTLRPPESVLEKNKTAKPIQCL